MLLRWTWYSSSVTVTKKLTEREREGCAVEKENGTPNLLTAFVPNFFVLIDVGEL
jgi:hypothetical protein